MKLHQHPDFRDAIVAASTYFAPKGISTQLIEKDYYVVGCFESYRAWL